VFKDVAVARLVAGALGGIIDWADTDLRSIRVLRSAVLRSIAQCPTMLEWMKNVDHWDEQKGGIR
jgi:hypothetical protein